MGTDRRDQAIERLFRQRSGAAGVSPADGPCVDGELLAAWTAGALRPAEAATIEDHLSNCLRCQSMVAAFVRTEPVAPVAVRWSQRWQVRWLVPIATAATVVAIYVATPDRELAVREFVTPQTKADAPATSVPQQRQPTAAAPVEDLATAQRSAAPTDTLARRRELEARAPTSQREEASKDAAAKTPRPESRTAGRTGVVGGVGAAGATGARGAAGAAAPAAPNTPATPATPKRTPATPVTPKPVTPAVGTLQESVALRGAPTLADQANRTNMDIESPDKSVRWRIAGGQLVGHSVRGSAQFAAVVMPTPGTVTAGHAPGASILWLVGPAGAIYLTTDGSRFERIPFVEATDLSWVTAVDDRQATVTTVDGRRFQTVDRGATWSRQ